MKPTSLINTSIALALIGSASAGITITAIPNVLSDAAEATIINTGQGLLSAANFGNDTVTGNTVDINGLLHPSGSGNAFNAPGFALSASGFEGDFRGAPISNAFTVGSDMERLLRGIKGGDPTTMTISGLTPGDHYLFQAYWETDDADTFTVTIEGDTETGIVVNQPNGAVIGYDFVAGDTELNFSLDGETVAGNKWISGYSLQAIPEPSAALLGALGALALLRRRRS